MSMFKRLFRKKASTSDEETTRSKASGVDRQAFGLKELSPGVNPVLDIVAVHGLNGHREDTWTAENRVNWLQHLLPQKIPHARIFSYGYDAKTHGFVSQQHLHDHGVALVADLSLYRRDTETERRPIIFVAHSLGGIICKIALIHANTASEQHLKEHKRIHLSTYGILFFGTPHQGGHGISLGKFLVNVASVFVITNKNLLKHLEMHSEMLLQQTSQYNAISSQFNTKFVYETNETITPLGSKLIVPKYSAVIPGAANAEEIPINGNHLNMVKFHSLEDEGFKRASTTIYLMSREALPQVEANWERYYMQNGLQPVRTVSGIEGRESPALRFPSVPTTEPGNMNGIRI